MMGDPHLIILIRLAAYEVQDGDASLDQLKLFHSIFLTLLTQEIDARTLS